METPEEEWPEQPPSFGEILNEDPEVKKVVSACLATITESVPTVKRLIEHFSSWYRVKKAVAVFLRLKALLQRRRLTRRDKSAPSKDLVSSPITVNEMEEAESAILRFTQTVCFPNKIKSLNETNHASDEYQEKIHTCQQKT